MRRLVSGLLLIGLCVAVAVGQVGKKKTADPRIKPLLDNLGLNYEVDDDGDYKLEFRVDEERTHIIWINSGTNTIDKLEVREVWGIGYVSEGALPAEIANRLLESSGECILGSWQVMTAGDKHIAVFAVKIPAEAAQQLLDHAIRAAVQTTDRMEKDLTGRDDF